MEVLLLAFFVIVVARAIHLHSLTKRDQLLRVETPAPLLRVELRRRPHLAASLDGMGTWSLPAPKETRTLVLRAAGLPIWHEVQSIALPRQVQDSIDAVGAGDFDAAFSLRFRVSVPAPVRPASPTGRPPATGAA